MDIGQSKPHGFHINTVARLARCLTAVKCLRNTILHWPLGYLKHTKIYTHINAIAYTPRNAHRVINAVVRQHMDELGQRSGGSDDAEGGQHRIPQHQHLTQIEPWPILHIVLYGEHNQYVQPAIIEASRPIVVHPLASLLRREFLLEGEHIRVARNNRGEVLAQIRRQNTAIGGHIVFHLTATLVTGRNIVRLEVWNGDCFFGCQDYSSEESEPVKLKLRTTNPSSILCTKCWREVAFDSETTRRRWKLTENLVIRGRIRRCFSPIFCTLKIGANAMR